MGIDSLHWEQQICFSTARNECRVANKNWRKGRRGSSSHTHTHTRTHSRSLSLFLSLFLFFSLSLYFSSLKTVSDQAAIVFQWWSLVRLIFFNDSVSLFLALFYGELRMKPAGNIVTTRTLLPSTRGKRKVILHRANKLYFSIHLRRTLCLPA